MISKLGKYFCGRVFVEHLFIAAVHLSSSASCRLHSVQPGETAPCGPLTLLDGRSELIGRHPICRTIWAFQH